MRIIKKLFVITIIVLVGVILSIFSIRIIQVMIKDISYTKIHVNDFAELQTGRNVSKRIIDKLPKNIKNIYLDYNQSYTSIFISFNISASYFQHLLRIIK